MNAPRFQWLAAVVAAHPQGTVIGRKRLQKTIRLLQRIDLPTDYCFQFHFYGPYSEEIQSDLELLRELGMVIEERQSSEASTWFVIRASDGSDASLVSQFSREIRAMAGTDADALEVASTYDFYREMGLGHEEAVERTKEKKPSKCSSSNLDAAMKILREIGLLDASRCPSGA
jgi:uncharacterized protein YwgA